MRIGLFTDQYYPAISGVVTSIKMLYEGLTAMGHECYIFTCFDPAEAKNDSELLHKNVINVSGRPYPFKAVKEYRYTVMKGKLVKEIKKYNLDVIHVHTEFSISKLAIKASKKLHIPTVHTLHTLWSEYIKYVSPWFDRYMHNNMLWLLKVLFTKPICKHSMIDIVPTQKVYEQAKVYGLGTGISKAIRVIPTGIELSRFYASNFSKEEIDNLRVSLNIKKNQFVFLYVGRVSEEKQIPVVMDAFAKTVKGDEKYVLLIVGGGPSLENMKKKVVDLGIENQTIFTDLVPWDVVPMYYQLGDIFVTASQSETQGLTYIEALASSTPILVQKDDCLLDVVQDYYNGISYDGVDELAVKMAEIIKAPETLKSIRSNTLPSVMHYSKEEYAKNIYNVYEEAIQIYQERKTKKKNK